MGFADVGYKPMRRAGRTGSPNTGGVTPSSDKDALSGTSLETDDPALLAPTPGPTPDVANVELKRALADMDVSERTLPYVERLLDGYHEYQIWSALHTLELGDANGQPLRANIPGVMQASFPEVGLSLDQELCWRDVYRVAYDLIAPLHKPSGKEKSKRTW